MKICPTTFSLRTKRSKLIIRQLCKQRGLSINKLADMAGLRQSLIDNIVNGRTKNPGTVNLHKIALAFGMTLAEFLDFEELNNYSFEE